MTTENTQIRPMLAAQKFDEQIVHAHLAEDKFLYVQPKIDGMRVVFDRDGIARSRSWKPHANKYLQQFAQDFHFELMNCDGEVISGHTYDPTVFRTSMSGIRSEEGSPEFTVYLFDIMWPEDFSIRRWRPQMLINELSSHERSFDLVANKAIKVRGTNGEYCAQIVVVPNETAATLGDIYELERKFLEQGWEGAIVRRSIGGYKFGRSTAKQGLLTKLKRFEDAEAVVVGYEPRYQNNNPQTENELGLTSRSAHQENLVALDCLGALQVVMDYPPLGNETQNLQIHFSIGVFDGLSMAEKESLWLLREQLIGKTVKFKHQGYGGGYTAPRTPVFKGFRDPIDIG
jgi:DNA ligase-1